MQKIFALNSGYLQFAGSLEIIWKSTTSLELLPIEIYIDPQIFSTEEEEVVTRLGRVSSGQILIITLTEFLGGPAVEYGGTLPLLATAEQSSRGYGDPLNCSE